MSLTTMQHSRSELQSAVIFMKQYFAINIVSKTLRWNFFVTENFL